MLKGFLNKYYEKSWKGTEKKKKRKKRRVREGSGCEGEWRWNVHEWACNDQCLHQFSTYRANSIISKERKRREKREKEKTNRNINHKPATACLLFRNSSSCLKKKKLKNQTKQKTTNSVTQCVKAHCVREPMWKFDFKILFTPIRAGSEFMDLWRKNDCHTYTHTTPHKYNIHNTTHDSFLPFSPARATYRG